MSEASGSKGRVLSHLRDMNGKAGPLPPIPSQIKVDGANPVTFEWCSSVWNLSTISSLSISGNDYSYWAKTLESFCSSLEKLEILIDIRKDALGNLGRDRISMPKLSVLCLLFSDTPEASMAVRWWLRYIKAPELFRVVFHCEKLSQTNIKLISLGPQVESAINRFPKLKEIGILTPPKSVYTPNLLNMQEVFGWCKKGLTVEVITQSGGKRIYTKEDLSN